jgi:nuclear transport factor 2 (NTF2) superfamily protein
MSLKQIIESKLADAAKSIEKPEVKTIGIDEEIESTLEAEILEHTCNLDESEINESEKMSDAAHELVLHADNTSQLYKSSHQPIVANLKKKAAKGQYDKEKAKKLWGYHADRAAQSYAKEHGDGKTPWHKMFTTADRKQAAAKFEADNHDEIHSKNESVEAKETKKKEREENIIMSKKKVSEQVQGLLAAEGLSEEFREQAATLFEAAIADRMIEITKELQEQYTTELEEVKESLSEKTEKYLEAATAAWIAENQVAIKASYKSLIAEKFIDGVKQLMEDCGIEIPHEDESALEAAMTKVSALEEKLSEKHTKECELMEEIANLKKVVIKGDVSEGLTVIQTERFEALVEHIEFKNDDQYRRQLEMVKESFLSGKTQEPTKAVVTESKTNQKVIVESTKTKTGSTVESYLSHLQNVKF